MTVSRQLIVVLAFVAVALFLPQFDTSAQAEACSHPLLVAFSADSQYDEACEAFTSCIDQFSHHVPCTLDFLDARISICPDGDLDCGARASLHTALIGLASGVWRHSSDLDDEFWTGLADQITGSRIDSDTALAFEHLAAVYGEHPMLHFVYGVIAQASGDSDAAAQSYSAAQAMQGGDPLVLLARADLYAASGDALTAALDYHLVAPAAGEAGLPENIAARLADLPDVYRLNLSAAEVLSLYPMLMSTSGPGSTARYDLSQQSPIPVRLLVRDDRLLFIPDDSAGVIEPSRAGVRFPVYPLTPSDYDTYSWSARDYYFDSGSLVSLSLPDTDGVYQGARMDYASHGGSVTEFFIAPIGADDPRPQGMRCGGGPQSRLLGSPRAAPLTYSDSFPLYDAPGGESYANISFDDRRVITIQGEPECVGDAAWWPVTLSLKGAKQSGWIRENDGDRYLFDPQAAD